MPSRRKVLATTGIGLTGIGSTAAVGASQEDPECDECMEILHDTSSGAVTVMEVEDGYYEYVVDKEDKTVSYRKLEEAPDEQEVQSLATGDGVSTLSAHDDIITWWSAWSGTIGSYLGTPQKEYGVAFTSGEDLGNYTGAAIGGAVCSLVGVASTVLGAITGAACSVLGSAILDFETDGNEGTVGLWDEEGGLIGEPYIRIGAAGGHHYSHDDLTETDSFPGMIEWYT